MNAPGAQRNPLIRDRVAEIRQAIEEAKAKEVTLADLGAAPRLPGESLKDASTDQELTPLSGPPAIDLPGLERLLLSVAATARFFAVHPAIPGAYLLDLGDGADRSVYRHLGSPACHRTLKSGHEGTLQKRPPRVGRRQYLVSIEGGQG